MFLPKERGAQKMVCGNMETETSMSSLDQLYDEHPEKVKNFDKSLRKKEHSSPPINGFLPRFLSWLFGNFSELFCFIVTSLSSPRIKIQMQIQITLKVKFLNLLKGSG